MGPSVTRLEIVGPATIAQGQSVQYSAVEFLENGSSRPATRVAWSAGPSVLLHVTATGLVSATSFRGDATLRAEVAGSRTNRVKASREIVVLPDGTFRVVGTVTEADAANVPIHGARVEAASDAEFSTIATFATSGPDGRYKLYGVPRDGYFRVRSEGYDTRTDRIQIATHETRNVQLQLENARPALAGDYTMTIEAGGGSCGLADDPRRRTYDAAIAQNGPHLTVTLTGAPLFVAGGQGNRFTGVVTATGATFTIRTFADPYYYVGGPAHPDVVERLGDDTLLVVAGSATVGVTSNGLSGSMGGELSRFRGTSFSDVIWMGSCDAVRLTLTRR